jgi:hypothetical protein
MFGVTTVLDDEHYKMVEDLWREFKERFGVHGIHISFSQNARLSG